MLLQILVIIFAAFAISRSFLRFRKSSESLLEFVLWILVWSSVIVVVLYPEITAIPASLFGIERGVDFLIYISIMFLFYSMYRVYAKIEKIEQDITKLTRAMTLKKK